MPQDQRPIVNRKATQAPLPAVQARPIDRSSGFQPDDLEVQGLLKGLSSFQPALREWADRDFAQAEKDAARLRKATALDGAAVAAGLSAEESNDLLAGKDVRLPVAVPAAFGQEHRDAMVDNAATRAAVRIKADAVAEFHDKAKDPEFQVKPWLAEVRQKALAGVTEPRALAAISGHLTELEANIMGEAEKQRLVRIDMQNAESLSAITRGTFGRYKPPQQMLADWGSFEARMGRTHSKPALVRSLFTHLQNESAQAGGMPELFDVFNLEGPDGKTLLDSDASLAPMVNQAKAQAVEAVRKREQAEALPRNAALRASLEERLRKDPEGITVDELMSQVGPNSVFNSDSELAAFRGRHLDALEQRAGARQTEGLADQGRLFRVEASVQNKVLDKRLGGGMDAFLSALDRGDVSTAAQVGSAILQAQSRMGSTVAWDQFKGAISTLATTLQNGEAPSPQFEVAAALFKALESNPQYRKLYFSDDVADVLRAYTQAAQGTDSAAAYQAAYASTTPEAKARAAAFASSDEGKKLRKDRLEKLVSGVSWVPFTMKPDATPALRADTQFAVDDFLRANPHASNEEVRAYAREWVGQNYVLDRTSGQAVRVPQGVGDPHTSEAISAYTALLADAFRTKDRNDSAWTPRLTLQAGGRLQVTMFNGASSQAVGAVDVGYLVAWHNSGKDLSDPERITIGAIKAAAKSGQVLDNVDPELLAKAKALGYLSQDSINAYRRKSLDAFTARLRDMPKMALQDYAEAPAMPAPRKGADVDHRITAQVARQFLASPGGYMALAASLVAVGEGIALQAYEDPAWKAGKNIGAGYNLKANASFVMKDLQATGLDEAAARAVVDGRARLTPDQASRLLRVALPRYEDQARKAAEETAPGLWARMPDAQKAVMVDIAYQTGDPAQFRKAWQALAKGDMKAFAEESKVTYEKSPGVRVEDKTRNGHRAALLAGLAAFEARLGTVARIPSGPIQVQ